MIPKTYYDNDDFGPGERRYLEDFWSWLEGQPQDTWLLWARNANWDNADTVFEAMIARPDCDLALVSWIFWGCNPGYHVENPSSYAPQSLIAKIVSNCETGLYQSSHLFLDRYEVVIAAHEYLKAIRRTRGTEPPFRLPRQLCGPFDGRRATISPRYDDQTEADLAEIFALIDGHLPRSEKEHWKAQLDGGNLWIVDRLKLPAVPRLPQQAFQDLDDAGYVEAIFGEARAYESARPSYKKKWWPSG